MSTKHNLLATCALISSTLLASAANPQEASATTDIPYGIEAVTQYRSEYSYRGFTLAQDTLDFQLGASYAFDSTTYLNSTAWFGTEIGDGDFSEGGILVDLRKDVGDVTFSLSASYQSYQSYSNTFFESGANLGSEVIYHFNKSFDFSTSFAYDTGAEGWYGNSGAHYYFRINDDSFINLSAGVSYVSSYYQRDGFNDAFGKLSYTYNINQSVSVSPYVGTSVLLDNDDAGRDSLHGGIYFAVSF